jgi:hypothetical protein
VTTVGHACREPSAEWIATLGACAALSALHMGASAHAYDAGDAALGGFVGGVVGGLIGSGAASHCASMPRCWKNSNNDIPG